MSATLHVDDDGNPCSAEGCCDDEHESLDIDHDPVSCPQCGGEPALLGQLGRTVHLRCVSCGWTFAESEGVTS